MNFIDGKALLLMSKTTPDCQFAYIYPVTKSPPPNPLLVQTVAEGVAESMAAPPTTCAKNDEKKIFVCLRFWNIKEISSALFWLAEKLAVLWAWVSPLRPNEATTF